MTSVFAVVETCPDPRTEAEFQWALVRLLRAYGWRVSHNQPAKAGKRYITTGSPGWPDLVALRPPDLVFLECKVVGGAVRPDQRLWINGLADVEGTVRAWIVDVGAWPILVRLARDGIGGVETEEEDSGE